MNIKKYYSASGKYLAEHKKYFTKKQLEKDVKFIIDVLNLKKKDKILDLACGHGRHTIELKKQGFDIDGLDSSGYLLNIAKKNAEKENLKINFYHQDIHNIKIRTRYDKIFLFFSEFGLFNPEKVLNNIASILKTNGLFLLDSDNVFRLIQYLIKYPKALFQFDFVKMELKEKKGSKKAVRYYTVPELKKLFTQEKLIIKSIYGNYKKDKLDIDSKRIIIIGKK